MPKWRPRTMLAYEAAEPAAETAHPWRNVWIPSIFLAIGLLATAVWMHLHQITRGALIAVCFLLASATMPVIVVFIGYGVFFGVFEWLLWTGAIAPHMRRGLTIIFMLFVLCMIAVIWGASYPLFNDQDDDFVSAGVVLAGLAWIMHFFLFVLVVVGLASIANSILQKRQATFAAATSGPAPAPASTAPSAVAATDADRQLVRDIAAGIVVHEARDWKRMRFAKDPATDALVEQMYSAGARKVYIDLRGAQNGKPALGYVELPPDAKTQAACNAVYQAYLKENGMTFPPPGPPPVTRRFMAIQLKQ